MLKKSKLLLLISSIFVCGSIGLLCYSASVSDKVVINEVCSSNFSVVYDENGNASDYIELYNPSWIPVSLSGYSLSDSEDELRKCNLDSVILGPKSYLVIFADGSSDEVVGHTSFSISGKGENVYLSNAKGNITDIAEIPRLDYNTVYARIQDGGHTWERKEPTPGYSNDGADIVKIAELAEPVFSYDSGFYDDDFWLEITAGEEEVIYYTLDGSEPDEQSIKYTGPLLITDASLNENVYAARTDLSPENDYVPEYKVDKATVVRAISYNDKTGQKSDISTKTYFVNYDTKMEYLGIPIVSIVTDPNNLFDYYSGIYGNGIGFQNYLDAGGICDGEILKKFTDENGVINYLYEASNAYNRGREWEKEAVMTYFDEEHQYIFAQDVGIRISGQSSRRYSQKSFNIFARDIYDENDILPYDFWGKGYKYSSVKLRNGGSDNGGSKIKDPFIHDIVSERNVSVQDTAPCIAFLNGEYWGTYNLRERYQQEYFYNHFALKNDEIFMIDAGEISYGDYDAWNAYIALLELIDAGDSSDDKNYSKICEMLDIQSFIDFLCINIYVDNQDVSFNKNIALWRSKTVGEDRNHDGKWRVMMYDLDNALFEYSRNSFTESIYWKEEGLIEEEPVKTLLQNEEFKKQFVLSFMDIANETFDYTRISKKLDEWNTIYENIVPKDHRRFYRGKEDNYKTNIQNLDTFFYYRAEYITDYLRESLNLNGTKEKVVIDTNIPQGGTVEINTLQLSLDGAWCGEYYTDYPITVTAIPADGYRFAGWTGDIQSAQEQMEVEISQGGIVLCAEFEKIN